jgi:hypothetical protein
MTITDQTIYLDRVRDLADEVRSVEPTLRRLGEVVAALVCRELDIPTVRVRWLPAGKAGPRGVTYPHHTGEVWVRVQEKAATVETVAHEVRHAWQLQSYRWATKGLQTMEEREADARDYGRRIRAELT